MICEEVTRHLDPYVDRELDPELDAAVREHLSGCPTCRQRVADRQALGRLVRAASYHAAPATLRTAIARSAARAQWRRQLVTLAAAAALIVSIGGSLIVVRSMQMRSVAGAVAEEVVADHVRSLMENHLFDVRSTDQHTVKPWFLGKLDFSPPVTDLASSGFPLVGGRVDYVSGQKAAALVYERRKHTINVFIWPNRDASSGAFASSVRGFHAMHWTHDGMSFWAVSDLNATELAAFAKALQQ